MGLQSENDECDKSDEETPDSFAEAPASSTPRARIGKDGRARAGESLQRLSEQPQLHIAQQQQQRLTAQPQATLWGLSPQPRGAKMGMDGGQAHATANPRQSAVFVTAPSPGRAHLRDRDPSLLREEEVDCGGRVGGIRETLTSAGAVASTGGWIKDSKGSWIRGAASSEPVAVERGSHLQNDTLVVDEAIARRAQAQIQVEQPTAAEEDAVLRREREDQDLALALFLASAAEDLQIERERRTGEREGGGERERERPGWVGGTGRPKWWTVARVEEHT